MATNAILRMQSIFFADGYSILYLSRFVQDCLENLFSIIRSKQRRPTPLQFKSHLRTITLAQYMMEVKRSSYSNDDREYLSGFMDQVNSINKQQQLSPASSSSDTGKHLEFSMVEVSAMAKQTLSTINNAETNAIFHVAGYMMGSVKKNSTTCSNCLRGCITPIPFDRTFGKFSNLLATMKKKSFTYASDKNFHFVVCMDYIVQQHFSDRAMVDKTVITSAIKSLMSLPLDLPSCHNIKMKLVKKFLHFKMKTERIRKTRKRKFDSRSMLN